MAFIVAVGCIGTLSYKLENKTNDYIQIESKVKKQSSIIQSMMKEQEDLFNEKIVIEHDKKVLNDELFNITQENNKLKLQIEKAKNEVRDIGSRSVRAPLVPNTQNKNEQQLSHNNISQKGKNLGVFTSTFYDLSVQSCGKSVGSKGYGLTASGVSLVGKSRGQAMTIATDPNVIPLGSKVYVEYSNSPQFNGVYTSNDTGGAIKGNIIDTFMGDFSQSQTHDSVWKAGRQQVNITLLD